MEIWGLNRFTILLWNNFILKWRHFIALVIEIFITILFASTLLLLCKSMGIKELGPYVYNDLDITSLPNFFTNANISSETWELAYVPSNNSLVQEIIGLLSVNLNYTFKDQGFASEKDFEDYVTEGDNHKNVLAAIIFEDKFSNNEVPNKVRYHLRLSSYQRNRYAAFIRFRSWDTNVLYPPHPIQGPRFQAFSHGGSPGYFTEGFLALQHAVAMSLIAKQNYTKFLTLSTVRNLRVFAKRFPYPKYQHDFFFHFFSNFVPLVVLFVFFMNHLTLIQSIVWEKDKGLKEYQLMIGLHHWMLWAAYFFTYLTFHLISISVLCIVLFVKMEPRPVLQHSELSLIVVCLLCFAFATTLFSFMTSTIFSKGSELGQESQGILNYHIPRKDNNWGKVFGILEKAKQQYDLEDYCIGQMTLEQIFLTFSMPYNAPGVPDDMKKRELDKVSVNKMDAVSLEEKDKSHVNENE